MRRDYEEEEKRREGPPWELKRRGDAAYLPSLPLSFNKGDGTFGRMEQERKGGKGFYAETKSTKKSDFYFGVGALEMGPWKIVAAGESVACGNWPSMGY